MSYDPRFQPAPRPPVFDLNSAARNPLLDTPRTYEQIMAEINRPALPAGPRFSVDPTGNATDIAHSEAQTRTAARMFERPQYQPPTYRSQIKAAYPKVAQRVGDMRMSPMGSRVLPPPVAPGVGVAGQTARGASSPLGPARPGVTAPMNYASTPIKSWGGMTARPMTALGDAIPVRTTASQALKGIPGRIKANPVRYGAGRVLAPLTFAPMVSQTYNSSPSGQQPGTEGFLPRLGESIGGGMALGSVGGIPGAIAGGIGAGVSEAARPLINKAREAMGLDPTQDTILDIAGRIPGIGGFLGGGDQAADAAAPEAPAAPPPVTFATVTETMDELGIHSDLQSEIGEYSTALQSQYEAAGNDPATAEQMAASVASSMVIPAMQSQATLEAIEADRMATQALMSESINWSRERAAQMAPPGAEGAFAAYATYGIQTQYGIPQNAQYRQQLADARNQRYQLFNSLIPTIDPTEAASTTDMLTQAGLTPEQMEAMGVAG